MSIENMVIQDDVGNAFDLLTNLVPYGNVSIREEAKRTVVLMNRADSGTENITIQAIAHPTAQIGRAQDTWEAMTFALDELGPWFNILQIPYMSAGQKLDLWMKWTVPASAIPGYGQFALEINGEVVI